MNVLKFDPTTNEHADGKVDIGDCSFVLPNPTLPLTLATAFVDANYPDTAPYFSTYENGLAWVLSKIGTDGVGNMIITSNQADCELESNVNVWLAPGVTINSFTATVKHDISIDGFGIINSLQLSDTSNTKARFRKADRALLSRCNDVSLYFDEVAEIGFSTCFRARVTATGVCGTLDVSAESTLDYTGGVLSSIKTDTDSDMRLWNARVLGRVQNGTACMFSAHNCEFYNTAGTPTIESIYDISLSDCWVYNNSNYCVLMNDQLQQASGRLILNNTNLWTNGTYSIADGSRATNPNIYSYGGSCTNKPLLNCVSAIQAITINQDMIYKAY